MNEVGSQGRGESIWLAWFLIDVLKNFLPICELRNDLNALDFCKQRIQLYKEAVESQGWDGDWYRRGYFDDGTPLGSRVSEEARIDSLPQSWGIISGEADRERAQKALESVQRLLIRQKEKLVLLFTPPFDCSTPHPGYIMGYPPGVRENGGQYTHAAIWVAMAFARLGDGKAAADVLRLLNPVEHTRTPSEVALYKGEPYVVAADVYALTNQEGRCGWTWYTGSSGWMYRVWLEEVLGFRLRGQHLMIDPVIPPDWMQFSISYRFRETLYRMTVENPDKVGRGVLWIEMDGVQMSTPYFVLQDDKVQHAVRIRLGGKPLPKEESIKGVDSSIVGA
jgi:cyclic beta-1,2-glucan synthetase